MQLTERRSLLKLIPEIVRQLIVKHIHSVDVVEILLLLRQEPHKEWGALAIGRALRMERISVEARLQTLLSAQLASARQVGAEQLFRYDPSTIELRRAVDELANWYSSHRVAIIALIYS